MSSPAPARWRREGRGANRRRLRQFNSSIRVSFMRQLSSEDIEALAVGAWILGTGGGGSPYHALLNLRRLYEDGSRVDLIDIDELHDDDAVAVVSVMGAPLVILERLVDSRPICPARSAIDD